MNSYIAVFGASFLGMLIIVAAHLVVGRLRDVPTFLLDASAGIAIAYAFVDVFPHLASFQAKISYLLAGNLFGYFAHHTYIVALFGFSVYLGVRVAMPELRDERTSPRASKALLFMFASFCLYNFLIGYMLAEQATHRAEPSLLFALAMAAHFVGLDHDQQQTRPEAFDRFRYAYIASLATGWVAGVFTEISDAAFALWFAYLAGGIISAGVASEMPRIRSMPSFAAFCVGALVFTVLILAVESYRGGIRELGF